MIASDTRRLRIHFQKVRAPMPMLEAMSFVISSNGVSLLRSDEEGGGYTSDILRLMLESGLKITWDGRQWVPDKLEKQKAKKNTHNIEVEQLCL